MNLLKVTTNILKFIRCIFSWFEAAWHFRLGHYNARILVLFLPAKPTTTTYHCLFLQSQIYNMLVMMLIKIMRSCTWNLKTKHIFLFKLVKWLCTYMKYFYFFENRVTLIIGWLWPLFEILKVWLKQINSTLINQ